MRVPLSWLREYVDVSVTAAELAERLTFSGIEVSDVEAIGVLHPKVICAELLVSRPLEGRENVREVELQVGEEVIRTISVAPDLVGLPSGTKLALALTDAVLYSGEKGDFTTKTITATLRYNRECSASLCSLSELGIANEGRLCVLPSDSPISTPVRDILERTSDWFADEVLVIEILANIARCQSISGIAREVAAILRQPLKKVSPVKSKVDFSASLVENKIPELVPYFSVVRIEGVVLRESTDHIKRLLSLSGIKSINNVVDIGNFVMLETGQPLHVYDAQKLPSQGIGVRLSEEGETFRPLGSEDLVKLPSGLITVRAGDDIIALAGLIGSEGSAVSDSTRDILLEVANFDLISIRKAQGKLKTYTEASSRFSRGVSLDRAEVATQRFIELLSASSPDSAVVAAARAGEVEVEERTIPLSLDRLNASLGATFSSEEVKELLERVDIHFSLDEATVPASRDDLHLENDLFEEVARLLGYDRMPITMPESAIPLHPVNQRIRVREAARDAMVLSGLNEIITYSMTVPEKALWHKDEGDQEYVSLRNPVSADKTVLRRTLAPGMLQTIAHNLKYSPSCQLFEIGNVFIPRADTPLPYEPCSLVIGLAGQEHGEYFHDKKPRELDVFDLKGKIEFLLQHLRIEDVVVESFEGIERLYQPGLCGVIRREESIYGYIGKVHPTVASRYGIDADVFCAEIDLEQVILDAGRPAGFKELEKFPGISIDISLLVKKQISAQEITLAIQSLGCSQLRTAEVIDLYGGAGVAEDKKSLSLRLTLCDSERTLEQSEANQIRDSIVASLAGRYGVELR